MFCRRLLTEVCSHVRVEFHMNGVCAIGLHVVKVAHNIQVQVAKYIRETLGLVNSYDTWHGIFVFQ